MEEKKSHGTMNKNTESDIKEFVHKSKADRKSISDIYQKMCPKQFTDYRPLLYIAGGILVLLGVILCGILLCKIPVATAVIISLLEVLLAVSLCKSPLWLHGLAVVLNIVLGIVFDIPVFMVLASAVYVLGILLLHFADKGKQDV